MGKELTILSKPVLHPFLGFPEATLGQFADLLNSRDLARIVQVNVVHFLNPGSAVHIHGQRHTEDSELLIDGLTHILHLIRVDLEHNIAHAIDPNIRNAVRGGTDKDLQIGPIEHDEGGGGFLNDLHGCIISGSGANARIISET